MGSPGTVLVLLVQFWVLQGATGLTVQQAPKLLQVRQDSQATMACQVVQAQAWERLRVEWIKDADIFCQTHIINGSLSKDVCGPQGWLFWRPPGNLTLQLNHVSLNDSGLYVCGATVEIPDWEEAQGNGTQLLVETGGWRRPELLRTLLRAAGDGGRGRGRFRSGRWDLGPPPLPERGCRQSTLQQRPIPAPESPKEE